MKLKLLSKLLSSPVSKTDEILSFKPREAFWRNSKCPSHNPSVFRSSLLSLNDPLDSWVILTIFKSIKYFKICYKYMKALYIQARTTPYSELIFSSILLYCSLTVGDRTFLKVTGVAKQRILFRTSFLRS